MDSAFSNCSVFCEFVENLFETVVALRFELFDAVVGDDAAVVDDDGSAAHCFDFLHNVCREQHYFAFPGFAYDFANLFQLVGIQACSWLVEDKHLWVVDHSLCQSHALTVAFGECAYFLAQFWFETCELYHLVDALAAVLDFVDVSYEAQELVDVHLGVERVVFGQIAYAGADLLWLVEDAVAAYFHFAFRRRDEAGDDFHQSGLAGTVWSQQSYYFASVDGEAYAVEGTLAAVEFGDIVYF